MGWVAGVIIDISPSIHLEESRSRLRQRLSEEGELQHLIINLEKEIERNPSAPFVENNGSTFVDRLDALVGENEYRAAVTPPLLLLLISVGIEWWAWALVGVPVLILVYGASLAKRDDIALLALGWLLDGKGTSHALEEIQRWAR